MLGEFEASVGRGYQHTVEANNTYPIIADSLEETAVLVSSVGDNVSEAVDAANELQDELENAQEGLAEQAHQLDQTIAVLGRAVMDMESALLYTEMVSSGADDAAGLMTNVAEGSGNDSPFDATSLSSHVANETEAAEQMYAVLEEGDDIRVHAHAHAIDADELYPKGVKPFKQSALRAATHLRVAKDSADMMTPILEDRRSIAEEARRAAKRAKDLIDTLMDSLQQDQVTADRIRAKMKAGSEKVQETGAHLGKADEKVSDLQESGAKLQELVEERFQRWQIPPPSA